MKKLLAGIAVVAVLGIAGPASAACNVTQTGLLGHSETDCASAADVSQNAADIATNAGNISSNASGIATNAGDIANLQTENAGQQTQINQNTSDIGDLQTENASQQTQINTNTGGVAANAATNAAQQTQIDQNTTKNAQQDVTLADHDGRISNNEGDIDALFDENDELRRDLRDAKDELEGGIAVANSLNIPQVDPTKSFAMSGNGGFYEGQSALGIGVALRFDDTWQAGGSVGFGLGDGGVGGKAAITGQW